MKASPKLDYSGTATIVRRLATTHAISATVIAATEAVVPFSKDTAAASSVEVMTVANAALAPTASHAAAANVTVTRVASLAGTPTVHIVATLAAIAVVDSLA